MIGRDYKYNDQSSADAALGPPPTRPQYPGTCARGCLRWPVGSALKYREKNGAIPSGRAPARPRPRPQERKSLAAMDGPPPRGSDGPLAEAHAHFRRGEHHEAEALYSAYIRQCACADGGARAAPATAWEALPKQQLPGHRERSVEAGQLQRSRGEVSTGRRRKYKQGSHSQTREGQRLAKRPTSRMGRVMTDGLRARRRPHPETQGLKGSVPKATAPPRTWPPPTTTGVRSSTFGWTSRKPWRTTRPPSGRCRASRSPTTTGA
ncbi:tetratricopeptide repeat protein 32 isoform X2 [Petaurus breviceps papuanus]|uniref:tetratricopeptide repeat protein 32 isoform X2 n=1 Tax=Petaurus breviceps papuanus TaxID=3040969 RepID=UPI0036DDFCFA